MEMESGGGRFGRGLTERRGVAASGEEGGGGLGDEREVNVGHARVKIQRRRERQKMV